MKLHVLSLAVLGLVASLSMAVADGGKPTTAPALKPGVLTATGAGVVEMNLAKATVVVEVAADGTVEMAAPVAATVDADKGTKDEVKGRGTDAKVTKIVYKGFTKATIIDVKGPIRIAGKGLTVTVTGNGRATMLGEGTYTATMDGADKAEGKWFVKPAAGDANAAKRAEPVAIGEQPKRDGAKAQNGTATPKADGDGAKKPANDGAKKQDGEGA